jgi:predicted ArsR family transcriptional regulator
MILVNSCESETQHRIVIYEPGSFNAVVPMYQMYYNVFSWWVNHNKHHIYLLKSILIRISGYNKRVKTSRQRLLEYIQAHHPVTVAELSRVLRMSRANARHHLSILEQQGLIRLAGQRPAEPGRGRPALLYALAETAQAHSLGQLCGVLLELLASERSSEQQPGLYRQVACALKAAAAEPLQAAVAEPPSQASSHLTQRLTQTVQQLNQLNYQARWEAHVQGPRLILGHCPYAAILSRHPEMCQIDRHLLQELAGAPVVQTERLALDQRGAPFCRFVLQTR